MPFYRITITDIYGHISQGIREDPMTDINAYYGKARRKAEIALKNRFRDIDVVMLVSSSKEVEDHLRKQTAKVSVITSSEELEKLRKKAEETTSKYR